MLTALLGMSSSLNGGHAEANSTCRALPEQKIGFQLFTVLHLIAEPSPAIDPAKPLPPGVFPHFAAQPEKFSDTLSSLHRIGFVNFERFSGTLDLPVAEYGMLAKKAGMRPIASHDKLDLEAWNSKIEQAKAFRQIYIGSSGFGAPGIDSLSNTLLTAANLNTLGKAAAASGLRFYVHNNTKEFSTRYAYAAARDAGPTSLSAWEIVAANTDPRYVHFEVDIHWARLGIGLDRFEDLLNFLRKYHDRIELLHVKDTAADGSIADLGEGTTDWPKVFQAAGPGVRLYLWEYDDAADPLKSAAIAHKFLRCDGQG